MQANSYFSRMIYNLEEVSQLINIDSYNILNKQEKGTATLIRGRPPDSAGAATKCPTTITYIPEMESEVRNFITRDYRKQEVEIRNKSKKLTPLPLLRPGFREHAQLDDIGPVVEHETPLLPI